MRALHSSLLLLPLLLLGCEGPAGKDGVNGVDGAAGADGTDGVDGADGIDGSVVVTDTLAPGEYLSLTHGLGAGDKAYEAQFTWNGVVYDHHDYPTLRPAHADGGVWYAIADIDGYHGEIAGAVLLSGETVFVQDVDTNDGDEEFYVVQLRDAAGTVTASLDTLTTSWSDDDGYGDLYDPVVVAVGDGGFVLFAEIYAEDYGSGEELEGVIMRRYDSAGGLVGTESFGDWGDARRYSSVSAISTADGGFAAVLGGWDDDTGNGFTRVVEWESGSGLRDFALADTEGSHGHLLQLDDGRLAMLVERRLAEDAPDGIDLLIAQPDGTLDAEVRLQDSSLTEDAALVLGSQGTILVAAESGGPDLPFYAVLDTDGNVVQPPTGMSGWENTMIEAAAFPDGDFFVLVTEDDSLAPMTWVVGAQGGLLRPMVVGDLTVVPDYDPGFFLPSDGNTVSHVAPSYDGSTPAFQSTYTKGLLQLRVVSDEEVRLYNETPDTLDVTMVVHRVP